MQKLIRFKDGAKLWGVTEQTFRRRVHEGWLPVYRLGKILRVGEDDLNRLLERQASEQQKHSTTARDSNS